MPTITNFQVQNTCALAQEQTFNMRVEKQSFVSPSSNWNGEITVTLNSGDLPNDVYKYVTITEQGKTLSYQSNEFTVTLQDPNDIINITYPVDGAEYIITAWYTV